MFGSTYRPAPPRPRSGVARGAACPGTAVVVARERAPGYAVDEGVGERLDRLCDADRIAGLDDGALRAQVDLARRLEGTAAVLQARATRELSRRGAIEQDGSPSTAAWLRERTGRSARDASRAARFASSFDDMPGTADALVAGRLGIESADTIVRAGRDGVLGSPDEVEAALLPVADGATPERLRADVRRREHERDGAALLRDERRQHARRRLSLTRRDDGMWDLYGRLTGESGNRLRTLLDLHDHPDPPGTERGRRRRPEQRLADALDTAVASGLDHGAPGTAGGVARPHVSVVVDLETFDADLADPDDPIRPVAPDDPVWARLDGARTAWAGTLSPQAARRICCDAAVSRIVTAGPSQVLDVGRATREWSGPQRRAIHVRDRGCRGPGCDRPIGWTHVHHVRWWRRGGTTDVANGLALCHACHRLVHDVGWHVALDPATAAATWTSPDRRRTVVTHPRPPT